MSDIVERLRKRRDPVLGVDTDCVMAANEIERLLAENQRVRQALLTVYFNLRDKDDCERAKAVIIKALERQDVE